MFYIFCLYVAFDVGVQNGIHSDSPSYIPNNKDFEVSWAERVYLPQSCTVLLLIHVQPRKNYWVQHL